MNPTLFRKLETDIFKKHLAKLHNTNILHCLFGKLTVVRCNISKIGAGRISHLFKRAANLQMAEKPAKTGALKLFAEKIDKKLKSVSYFVF